MRRPHLILVDLADRYGMSFIAYAGVSLASAVTEWIGFVVALRFVAPALAALIGFAIATLVNFALSRQFVFRSQRPVLHEFALLVGVSSGAFIVNFVVFYALFAFEGMHVLAAKVAGTVAGFWVNYLFRQFHIFSKASRFGRMSGLRRTTASSVEAPMATDGE